MLDQRTFDLHELCKGCHRLAGNACAERNIRLGFKEGSDRPVYVYADKDRIRQVLVNLLVNLIKYGWDGGVPLFGF